MSISAWNCCYIHHNRHGTVPYSPCCARALPGACILASTTDNTTVPRRWVSKGVLYLTNMRLVFVANGTDAESGDSASPFGTLHNDRLTARLLTASALCRALGVRAATGVRQGRQVQPAHLRVQQPVRCAAHFATVVPLHASCSLYWKGDSGWASKLLMLAQASAGLP